MSAPNFKGFRKVTGEEAPLFLSLGVLYADYKPYCNSPEMLAWVVDQRRMNVLIDADGIQFYIKVEE